MSLTGEPIAFREFYPAMEAMKHRGTGDGAGYAAWSPWGAVRVKVFVAGDGEEVEELLGPLTITRLGSRRLGGGVVLDDRLLAAYPPVEAVTRLRLLQYSRYLEAWKNIGWPWSVADDYRLWGRRSTAWIGHVRFPTNSPGYQPWLAHPFSSYETMIVHNGDLSSYGVNKAFVESVRGFTGFTGNDSEVIAHLLDIMMSDGYTAEDAVEALVYGRSAPRGVRLDGPYAVIFLHGTPRGPVMGAFVDRHHLRPLYVALCRGRLVAASEAAAVREAAPYCKPYMLRGGGYVVAYPDGELAVKGVAETPPLPQHPPPPPGSIDASRMSSEELNRVVAGALAEKGYVAVRGLRGHRFFANGLGPGRVEAWGVVGNASLNLIRGLHVTIHGDAQEDLCDSMEYGVVGVVGDVGDSAAQAMRGGEVYVAGNAGNRAGVQMKGGVLVIAGSAGDYLGEFMAGGVILVLGRAGRGVGAGMVGGRIYVASRIPAEDIGYAPPRGMLRRYLTSLALQGAIDPSAAREALKAETIEELARVLGGGFRLVEKLWGSLHLGYPMHSYRYLDDSEAEEVRRLVERLGEETGVRVDAEELLTRRFTVVEACRAAQRPG